MHARNVAAEEVVVHHLDHITIDHITIGLIHTIRIDHITIDLTPTTRTTRTRRAAGASGAAGARAAQTAEAGRRAGLGPTTATAGQGASKPAEIATTTRARPRGHKRPAPA